MTGGRRLLRKSGRESQQNNLASRGREREIRRTVRLCWIILFFSTFVFGFFSKLISDFKEKENDSSGNDNWADGPAVVGRDGPTTTTTSSVVVSRPLRAVYCGRLAICRIAYDEIITCRAVSSGHLGRGPINIDARSCGAGMFRPTFVGISPSIRCDREMTGILLQTARLSTADVLKKKNVRRPTRETRPDHQSAAGLFDWIFPSSWLNKQTNEIIPLAGQFLCFPIAQVTALFPYVRT